MSAKPDPYIGLITKADVDAMCRGWPLAAKYLKPLTVVSNKTGEQIVKETKIDSPPIKSETMKKEKKNDIIRLDPDTVLQVTADAAFASMLRFAVAFLSTVPIYLENQLLSIRYQSKTPRFIINTVLTYNDVRGVVGPKFHPGILYNVGRTSCLDMAKSKNATISFQKNGEIVRSLQATRTTTPRERNASAPAGDILSMIKQIEEQDIICKCWVQASQLSEVFPTKRPRTETERYFKITPDGFQIYGEINEKEASLELSVHGAADAYGFNISPTRELFARLDMIGLPQFGKPLMLGSAGPITITIYNSADAYKHVKLHVPFSSMSYGDIYLVILQMSEKASATKIGSASFEKEEETVDPHDFVNGPSILPTAEENVATPTSAVSSSSVPSSVPSSSSVAGVEANDQAFDFSGVDDEEDEVIDTFL